MACEKRLGTSTCRRTRGCGTPAGQLGFDRVEVRPDSLLSCAGLLGLSLMPDAATTKVYGEGSARALVSRALAAGGHPRRAPAVLLESNVANRPATALVFAHKPA